MYELEDPLDLFTYNKKTTSRVQDDDYTMKNGKNEKGRR